VGSTAAFLCGRDGAQPSTSYKPVCFSIWRDDFRVVLNRCRGRYRNRDRKIQNTLNLLHFRLLHLILHFRLLHLITQYLRLITITITIKIKIKIKKMEF